MEAPTSPQPLTQGCDQQGSKQGREGAIFVSPCPGNRASHATLEPTILHSMGSVPFSSLWQSVHPSEFVDGSLTVWGFCSHRKWLRVRWCQGFCLHSEELREGLRELCSSMSHLAYILEPWLRAKMKKRQTSGRTYSETGIRQVSQKLQPRP